MSYMKEEFDQILKDYGHKVYLQRKIQDSDGDDVYSNEFEIHLTRYTVNQNLSTIQTEEVVGIVDTSERLYYFRSEVHPFEGDRIYEYDPRVVQTVWEMDAVTMMRGLGGQLEYYTAGVTRIRPN